MPTSAVAKVIRLRSSGETVVLDDGPSTIGLCQRVIRASYLSYTEIADRAGLCDATVARVAYGDTKKPHLATVVRILKALGWAIHASR